MVGRYGNAVVAHDVRDRDLLTATPMFGRGMNSNDPVVGIGAGGWHTLLLLRSGQAWGFGSNGAGELGIGLTTHGQSRHAAAAQFLDFSVELLPASQRFETPQVHDARIGMSRRPI